MFLLILFCLPFPANFYCRLFATVSWHSHLLQLFELWTTIVGNSRLAKVHLSYYCFVHHVFVLILNVVPLGYWGKHKGASILYDSLSTNNWRTGMYLLKHCNYFNVASFVLFESCFRPLYFIKDTKKQTMCAYWIVTVATIVWSKLGNFNLILTNKQRDWALHNDTVQHTVNTIRVNLEKWTYVSSWHVIWERTDGVCLL